MVSRASITAVLLAGGLARRMGGTDKGLLPFAGRTLAEHVLARIAPQVGEIVISTANPDYGRLGHRLMGDAVAGHAGPLAGVLAVLESTDAPFVVSVPCDVPFLPEDLVQRLLHTCESQSLEASCVDDGERLHPVIALWRPAIAPRLRAYLESGERRVVNFYESLHHAQTDFSDQVAAFRNANTPEELQRMALSS